MKGYIYTMAAGADPQVGWTMSDPIFGDPPTLGACVPNVRRAVIEGDHVFVISGRVKAERQYVVGGLEVAEKIHHTEAFRRFPEYRVQVGESGQVIGNIIVDENGAHATLDDHSNFEARIRDYIVGTNPVFLDTPSQVERARADTMDVLNGLFDKDGTRPFDVIGRWRRLDEFQVRQLRNWLDSLRED